MLAVATKTKSFRHNPVIGSPALNRWGLHVARRRIAYSLGAARRRKLQRLISDADRLAFERDGFIIKPNFLDEATFQAVRSEVMNLSAEAREVVSGDTLTRLIAIDPRKRRALPTLASVVASDRYRSLLDYVGSVRSRPTVFVQAVFSHISDAPRDEQAFLHSDTFHPTVKSWLYLEDVGEHSVPFVYVPGSHRLSRRRLAWERRVSVGAARSANQHTAEGSFRITEPELRRLRYERPRLLPVPANTLIVADTSGFHARGASSLETRRVAIYGFSRSSPFLPWVFRGWGILSRLGHLAQRAVYVFARADSPRPVGTRSPIAPPAAAARPSDAEGVTQP